MKEETLLANVTRTSVSEDEEEGEEGGRREAAYRSLDEARRRNAKEVCHAYRHRGTNSISRGSALLRSPGLRTTEKYTDLARKSSRNFWRVQEVNVCKVQAR